MKYIKDTKLNNLDNLKLIFSNLNKNTSFKKIFNNFKWLISDKIFTMIIGVFITSIIARYFGPEKYGTFNYALSFTALFTALSTLGLETLVIKDIVDRKFSEEIVLYTSFLLRVIGGVLLTFLSYFLIRIVDPNNPSTHTLVFIMSIVMIAKAFEVVEYWIQAYQKSKISSIIRMVTYIITSVLKIFLVMFKGNLSTYSLIYLIDSLIIGVSFTIVYFKLNKIKFKFYFDYNYAKSILSRSWYMILSGLMVTLYMRVDQVMLGSMLSNKSELGIYSAAAQLATMWYFVPLAIITTFKPVIIRNKSIDNKIYLESVQRLYFIITWTGILFSLFILLFSKPIVTLLFGIEYVEAASILTVSVWAGIFATLGSARSIWLISEGLQKYTLVYTFFGFITNIILNYILIPTIGGYGAAIATLFSQFTANIIVLLFFEKTRISSIMILKSFRLSANIKLLRTKL